MSATRMLFLPYTPRADADGSGYDPWLRAVDNPFFNSRPGIRHYSNWKLVGGEAAFSHFDFLLLEHGVTPADIWSDAPLVAFAAEWVAKWGAAPDAADPSVNYHCYVADLAGGDAGPFSRHVTLDPAGAVGERWTFTGAIAGVPPWSGFARRFGAPGTTGSNLISAELIAAPADR